MDGLGCLVHFLVHAGARHLELVQSRHDQRRCFRIGGARILPIVARPQALASRLHKLHLRLRGCLDEQLREPSLRRTHAGQQRHWGRHGRRLIGRCRIGKAIQPIWRIPRRQFQHARRCAQLRRRAVCDLVHQHRYRGRMVGLVRLRGPRQRPRDQRGRVPRHVREVFPRSFAGCRLCKLHLPGCCGRDGLQLCTDRGFQRPLAVHLAHPRSSNGPDVPCGRWLAQEGRGPQGRVSEREW
mmetsp:Transcript_13248/g.35146  ORF Transcript_13248/g.35146 Transcript_13248/m.35146 type:complete len:240 (+) Transcript_13248:358-1077(+)